jgi:hypothetical protein
MDHEDLDTTGNRGILTILGKTVEIFRRFFSDGMETTLSPKSLSFFLVGERA